MPIKINKIYKKVKLNLKDLVQTFGGQGQEQYQLIREVTPILMQML